MNTPTPSPRALIQMLRIHMWSDECDDDSRWFCEQSAEAMEQMLDRCVRLSKQLEQLEAQS